MAVSRRLAGATRPNFISAVAAASDGSFVLVPGGVLILDARRHGSGRRPHQWLYLGQERVLPDLGRAHGGTGQ
jgi:hypothetical protein